MLLLNMQMCVLHMSVSYRIFAGRNFWIQIRRRVKVIFMLDFSIDFNVFIYMKYH